MKKIFVFMAVTLTAIASCNAQGKKKPGSNTGKPPVTAASSFFNMTIEGNGKKMEIASTQFKTQDGILMSADPSGKTLFMYGASNDKDDRNFSFQAWITHTEKGTYMLGKDASISIMTSLFPDIPLFMGQSGSIEVKDIAPKTGLIAGTFNCTYMHVKNDGSQEPYTISGSFKITRG